jgi:hypothetical protein
MGIKRIEWEITEWEECDPEEEEDTIKPPKFKYKRKVGPFSVYLYQQYAEAVTNYEWWLDIFLVDAIIYFSPNIDGAHPTKEKAEWAAERFINLMIDPENELALEAIKK